MKKNSILIAAFAVIVAASAAKAESLLDFDGGAGKELSLREAVITASEASGIPAPSAPVRQYLGNAEIGFPSLTPNMTPKIYLKSRQLSLKKKLLDYIAANETHLGLVDIIRKEDTVILFDSSNLYLASTELDIYQTITDAALINTLSIDALVQPNMRGKCEMVKKVLKKCGKWGQGVCLVWQLVEIWEEVCDNFPIPATDPDAETHDCISEGTC